MPNTTLPYFDAILKRIETNPTLEKTFGRHVHWGYWEQFPTGRPTEADFFAAAERLTWKVCDTAHITSAKNILDVGCGFGGTIASLNERYQNLNLCGLNIDSRQLARAEKLVTPIGTNCIKWVNADACVLPFDDETFDTVLAVECIFHFPNRAAFLQEAFRVLKPGGRLALSDFIAHPLIRPLTWIKSKLPTSYGFYGDCDVHCSLAKYQSLSEQIGFKSSDILDITKNTLPTYQFLRTLSKQLQFNSLPANIETAFAEYTSKLGLLQYVVLSWEKLNPKTIKDS